MAPQLFSFKYIYVEWVITKDDSIKTMSYYPTCSINKTLHQEVPLGMFTASSFGPDTKSGSSLIILLIFPKPSVPRNYLELDFFFCFNFPSSSKTHHTFTENYSTEEGMMPLPVLVWYYSVFRAEPNASQPGPVFGF